MARKRGKKLRYLPLEVDVAVGTLAANDVTSGNFAQTITGNRVYAVYAKGSWSIREFTKGDGPLAVGFAHSDYSSAEIEECIENTSSWDLGDKVGEERARRHVRRVGKFALNQDEDEVLGLGQAMYRKLGFWLEEDKTIGIWVRNEDGTASTAGAIVRFSGYLAVRVS